MCDPYEPEKHKTRASSTRRFFLPYQDFDLLGDPIPPNKGEPGRPAHAYDPRIANKIRVLLCAGLTNARIAKEIGVSVPVMRRVYFRTDAKTVKAAQRRAVADQRAKALLLLDKAAEAGNVSAIKAKLAILAEREQQFADEDEIERRGSIEPRRPEPLGKKERRQIAADEGEDEMAAWLDEEAGGAEGYVQ